MVVWRYIKFRFFAVAVGISILFFGLQAVSSQFIKLTKWAINSLYDYDFELEKYVLVPYKTMPRINDILLQTGIVFWIGIAFFIACLLPVCFIMKDYYGTKSIRTIMRLPISKTFYYVDKLLLPVFLLLSFWLMQLITIKQVERMYIREVPAEKMPEDVWMTLWNSPPVRLFYPFAELSHMTAALSFLILVPATVILFVLAERSKKRGIFSGVIACIGIITIVVHLFDLPVSPWLVPSITTAVLVVGIWHINRIQIT